MLRCQRLDSLQASVTAGDDGDGPMQVVAIAARDSEAKVREASLVAVGELAEHCLPEFAEQSASVLTFLYHALQDPVAKVQARACSALEAYCDHLGELCISSSCRCHRSAELPDCRILSVCGSGQRLQAAIV